MKKIHCGIIGVVVWLMTLGTLAAYDFEYDAGNIEGSKTSTGITYTLSVSKGNLGTSYDFDTRAGVTSGSPSGIDIDVTQNGATGIGSRNPKSSSLDWLFRFPIRSVV